MGDSRALSRMSLRQDQVLEFHLTPLPEPPPEAMKLPGMRQWFEQLRLMRERDTQSLYRLVNNLQISSNQTGSTPGGVA